MVDNFERVRKLLHFELPGDFYFAEIIQRGKDVGMTGEKLIKDYRIHSFEHYDTLKDDIIGLCDHYHARCYIRLNQRNTEELNLYLEMEMIQQQINKQRALRHFFRNGMAKQEFDRLPSISSAVKLYGSVMGQYSSEEKNTKKWIIDVDVEEGRTLEEIHNKYVEAIIAVGGKIYETIPSRTGQHIITTPFDVMKYSNIIGSAKMINKDGNTNLYIGD